MILMRMTLLLKPGLPELPEGMEEAESLCYSVICYRPCPDHGWDCKHKEVLASLGGIFDPTDDYLRVVRAELASGSYAGGGQGMTRKDYIVIA